ncbi:MAG: hypothetical protein U0234_24710 [Sandaracinus sp.]
MRIRLSVATISLLALGCSASTLTPDASVEPCSDELAYACASPSHPRETICCHGVLHRVSLGICGGDAASDSGPRLDAGDRPDGGDPCDTHAFTVGCSCSPAAADGDGGAERCAFGFRIACIQGTWQREGHVCSGGCDVFP